VVSSPNGLILIYYSSIRLPLLKKYEIRAGAVLRVGYIAPELALTD
jgi:hypothetical protein